MQAPSRVPVLAPVLVAAGGTGGHLFPAEALAAALIRRGIPVHLVTDRRAARYGGAFSEDTVHVVASATFRGRNPVAMAKTLTALGIGVYQANALIGKLKPAAVIGFGGYPTIPPVLAAAWRGVPSLIHDANAVIGRANRFLAPRVTAIATTFPDLFGNAPALAAKATLTGNPVRPAVAAAAATPYPAADAAFRLLVFGGSQGARIMADIVPPAIALLPPDVRSRLAIAQQARDEDVARVRAAYAAVSVAAEVAPFFADLPARMAASHLAVARSGASTVAELAAIGRPAILVPLPHALDQDQFANAGVLEQAGGAIRIVQDAFTPRRLADEIAALAAAPQRLGSMAAAAGSVGRLDAADRLADLVLAVARTSATK
jgi:UDP-N-acetylglucosamine--N-acetylmuramyl-(pentapeptide) pyrophosphoryl-undecaprenol N-acetylglucosamine transferase